MIGFPSVSLATTGLESRFEPGAIGLRDIVAWVHGMNTAVSVSGASGAEGSGAPSRIACLQLNAAAPGLRPRELERSGRRDIASLLKRHELGFSGLDLWIPPEHFADAAHIDRAVSAVIAAIEMAAEIGGFAGAGGAGGGGGGTLNVSIAFPRRKGEEAGAATGVGGQIGSVLATIASRADACGVRIADHAWPYAIVPGSADRTPVGVGLDPAAVLMAGSDPAREASVLGPRLVCARLSDCGAAGRVGVAGGEGRLDVIGYGVALVTAKYSGCVVLDLRGVRDPDAGVRGALGAWGG